MRQRSQECGQVASESANDVEPGIKKVEGSPNPNIRALDTYGFHLQLMELDLNGVAKHIRSFINRTR